MAVSARPSLTVEEEISAAGDVKAYVVAPVAGTKPVDVVLSRYARLFKEIVGRTAVMIAHWQAVGFCHGVMNTDNMSVLGITIDYGPFMFLDVYDPFARSNTTDDVGRYSFEHQPKIALWNLAKLGRTFSEIILEGKAGDSGPQTPEARVSAFDLIRQILDEFEPTFVEKYTELMRNKLGLRLVKANDLDNLVTPLLQLMTDACVDYSKFFRALSFFKTSDEEFLIELNGEPKLPEETPEERAEKERLERERIKDANRRMSYVASAVVPRARPASQPEKPPPKPPIVLSGCREILIGSLARMRQEIEDERDVYRILNTVEDVSEPASSRPESGRPKTGSSSANSRVSSGRSGGVVYFGGEQGAGEGLEGGQEGDGRGEEGDGGADPLADDPFEIDLPTEEDVSSRWQKWAKAYRARLLLERASLKSSEPIEVEDQLRSGRMCLANPLFQLRGWILDSIAAEVESMAELRPRDEEMERIERDLEEAVKYNREREKASRLRKDHRDEEAASSDALRELPQQSAAAAAAAANAVPAAPKDKPVDPVARAMRILVEDIWGQRTEAELGWEDEEDRKKATEWAGDVPRGLANLPLSCSS
ncbi:hypothetical protein HK101_002957 [Irineochytrium annulatum]|nr:hypothetical protein HK101_002957 [Irineochytrium annulatum]